MLVGLSAAFDCQRLLFPSMNRLSFRKFACSARRLLLSAMLTAALTFLATARARAATFNISDGNVAALISAIKTANNNRQNDTIELAANGTYQLTVSYNGRDGLPVIGPDGGKTLAIHGNGATIHGDLFGQGQPFRIIRFANGANVTI